MKAFSVLALALALAQWQAPMNQKTKWIKEVDKKFTFFYEATDSFHKTEYKDLVRTGLTATGKFFDEDYQKEFDVYLHPNRRSLDSTWATDWKSPGFKSECWMVASGVATRLDMLSPARWKTEACEHDFTERLKSQQLVTHELIHVFHAQHNPSPDFSEVSGIDWFVEGLATYGSGQCDSARLAAVKAAIHQDEVPSGLDKFWTGKLKYGLSGSVVMFIDRKFKRRMIRQLLACTSKAEILARLNLTEPELLQRWKKFMQNL
jgi:hypothetical protein